MLDALRGLGCADDEIIDAGLAGRNERGNVYDRFRNRLIIPIADARGRIVGFGGRALDPDDNVKYINSPQTPLFNKSQLLFGLDRARRAIRDADRAVVVEGYFDVIQAHQAGKLNVVAQMGTAMTEAQLRLLSPRHARQIVLALDADDAGVSATRRSLDVAKDALQRDYAGRLAVDIRILRAPAGKDPDDFLRESPHAWDDLIASAVSVADFVIDLETAALPPDGSIQQKQALAEQILPLLLASEDQLYQQTNLQKLARRLRIQERELLAWAQVKAPSSPLPQELPDLPPEYFGSDYDMPPGCGWGAAARQNTGFKLARRRRLLFAAAAAQPPNCKPQVNRKLRELAGSDNRLRPRTAARTGRRRLHRQPLPRRDELPAEVAGARRPRTAGASAPDDCRRVAGLA